MTFNVCEGIGAMDAKSGSFVARPTPIYESLLLFKGYCGLTLNAFILSTYYLSNIHKAPNVSARQEEKLRSSSQTPPGSFDRKSPFPPSHNDYQV
jgi:hypothetical protein